MDICVYIFRIDEKAIDIEDTSAKRREWRLHVHGGECVVSGQFDRLAC